MPEEDPIAETSAAEKITESRASALTGQREMERREMDAVFSLVYEELRRLASSVRRNEGAVTINSTALVHEAWMKLKDSPHLAAKERAHFKSIAAKAMRQVLVDEARKQRARKRGGSGEAMLLALGDPEEEKFPGVVAEPAGNYASSLGVVSCDVELLELDESLEELARLNPRQAKIVESRFFGGLNVAETAAALGVSESSVERDWRAAKAWLAIKIRSPKH
jgi:RNA polymerase sigma factor (sigma-70 family)